MKYIPLLLVFFSLNLQAEQMAPMWETEAHFVHYRVIMIASAVSRLQDATDSIEDQEIKERIQNEIKTIKLNLSYPLYESISNRQL